MLCRSDPPVEFAGLSPTGVVRFCFIDNGTFTVSFPVNLVKAPVSLLLRQFAASIGAGCGACVGGVPRPGLQVFHRDGVRPENSLQSGGTAGAGDRGRRSGGCGDRSSRGKACAAGSGSCAGSAAHLCFSCRREPVSGRMLSPLPADQRPGRGSLRLPSGRAAAFPSIVRKAITLQT